MKKYQIPSIKIMEMSMRCDLMTMSALDERGVNEVYAPAVVFE
jgi:hypothetical protein